MPHKLAELNAMSEAELRALGEKLNIKGAAKMDLPTLGFAILDTEAEIESKKPVEPKPAAKKRGRPKKEAPKADAKPDPKPETKPEAKPEPKPVKEEAKPAADAAPAPKKKPSSRTSSRTLRRMRPIRSSPHPRSPAKRVRKGSVRISLP